MCLIFFRYSAQRIEEWGRDVESSSAAKLKLPLLWRDPDTRLLGVNFDKDLYLLLREVKYVNDGTDESTVYILSAGSSMNRTVIVIVYINTGGAMMTNQSD